MTLLGADVSAMGLVPDAVVVIQTVEMLSEEVDTGKLVTKSVVSEGVEKEEDDDMGVVVTGGRKVDEMVVLLLSGGGGTEAIVCDCTSSSSSSSSLSLSTSPSSSSLRHTGRCLCERLCRTLYTRN